MKAITQSIFGSVVTVLLGVTFFGSINGQTASLTGEQAVKQLRETGSYDSLRAAFNDAQKHSGDKPLRPEVSQTKLIASDGAASDFFGTSVAISGETAIVGSARDDIGANIDQGSAYVFVRNGTTWTQQTKLIAADGAASDFFGISVAISGNTAIVGSHDDDIGAKINQGSAYIFVRIGGIWTQQTKLIAVDGAADDNFGWSVAISGDTAIVGSHDDDIGANFAQGSAYIFVRIGGIWTQQTKLIASDGAASDQFGWSVAISGNTVIVGSPSDDIDANTNQGSAYIFDLTPPPIIACTPSTTVTEGNLFPGGIVSFGVFSGPGSVTVDHVNAGTGLQSLTVMGVPTNAVVTIPPFAPGTFNPVVVTFTRPNPALPVDFTLRAASTFHAANVRVRCSVITNQSEPDDGKPQE